MPPPANPARNGKKLDDLSAQLAEFDLRCAAGDYETAARVLIEIDYSYLLLWGHYWLTINLHKLLSGHIIDKWLKGYNLTSLGQAYLSIGEAHEAIVYLEQALELDRENKDRQGEGADLGNLGNAYADLGNTQKAIEYSEHALVITREIGDRKGERIGLGNLGSHYSDLGDDRKAIDYFEQALAISREIGDREGEGTNLGNLGIIHGELGEAHKAIEFYEQADSARFFL